MRFLDDKQFWRKVVGSKLKQMSESRGTWQDGIREIALYHSRSYQLW